MIDHTTKPKSKNINLVLSGTGALYPVQAGAVCALLDLGYNIKSIAATSGGAIVGSCVCAGMSREKIKRKIINYNSWKVLLRHPRLPWFSGWGLFDNSSVEEILGKFFKGATFKTSRIPIEIVATQLYPTFGRYSFNIETSPDLTLAKACRISSSIPILFRLNKYKGMTFFDGSFSDDLPIQKFEGDFENTIALNVQVKTIHEPKTFIQFLRFCSLMIVNNQGYWKFTPPNLTMIPIEINNYSTPLQLNLSRLDRKNLFNTGYKAVINRLK